MFSFLLSVLLFVLIFAEGQIPSLAEKQYRILQQLPDKRLLDVLPSNKTSLHVNQAEDGSLSLTHSLGVTVDGRTALRSYIDFILYLATHPRYGPVLGPYGIAYFANLFSQKTHVLIYPDAIDQFLEMIEGNTANEILILFNVIVPLRLGRDVGLPVCFKTLDDLYATAEDDEDIPDDNYRETITIIFSELMRLHSRLTFDPRVGLARNSVKRLIDIVLDDIVLLHRDLHFTNE